MPVYCVCALDCVLRFLSFIWFLDIELVFSLILERIRRVYLFFYGAGL